MSFQPFVSRWYLAIPSTIAGGVLGRVVVGGDRVVDERDLHLAVARRRARRHASAPQRVARDDRRRLPADPARLGGARGARRRRAPRRRGAAAGAGGRRRSARAGRAAAAQAQLQLVGAAGPDRVGRRARRSVSGAWSPARRAGSTGSRARRAGAHAHSAEPGPAHADEVEAPRASTRLAAPPSKRPERRQVPKPCAARRCPRPGPGGPGAARAATPRPAAAPQREGAPAGDRRTPHRAAA